MELTKSERIQQKNIRTKEIQNMQLDIHEVENLSKGVEHIFRVTIECPEIKEEFSPGFSSPGAKPADTVTSPQG